MDLVDFANYLSGFFVLTGIYAIFTLGLNVHWGFTGLFNIGIAGFFALGAYTSALVTTVPPDPELFERYKVAGNLPDALGPLNLGIDAWFFLALGAAAVVSGIAALVIGSITLRLRDDYLAISTLGIAETVRLVFLNEGWLANGTRGMYRIPKFLGDWVSPEHYDYLYAGVVLVILVFLYVVVERLIRSPWGRVLRAIREDELTAAASGKNVSRFKLEAFVLGAAVMGIGGAVYAHGIRFIDPFAFDPLLATFIMWVMLTIGGTGNNLGAILGAFVVWGIWSGTQFLPGLEGEPLFRFFDLPNFRFFLIGFLLVAVILIRPGGLLGERRGTTSGPTPVNRKTPADGG